MVTCEVKIMFPLTKNRLCFFFFGADLRNLLNMSCSVFFNHGRTSVAVVVGDVLWCGKEFYNNFLSFIYRNDFNRSKSNFRLDSQQQKPSESVALNNLNVTKRAHINTQILVSQLKNSVLITLLADLF